MYGDEPTMPHGPTQPGDGVPVEPPTPVDPYILPVAYPAPGYAYPPPAPRPTNTMAILSLVFAFVFWPLAIIFGHIGKRQITRTGEAGGGLATAGLIMGYLWLGLTVCLCCGALNLIPHGNGTAN
jgi:hypothetical protein